MKSDDDITISDDNIMIYDDNITTGLRVRVKVGMRVQTNCLEWSLHMAVAHTRRLALMHGLHHKGMKGR